MSDRIATYEEVWTQEDGDLPENVIELVAWLNSKLALIPQEHRHSATLEWGSDEGSVEITLRYSRPETNEEYAARKRNWEARNERLERAQLARLLKKYGRPE